MPFIWRSKSAASARFDPAALACLEAAYVLLPDSGKPVFSGRLPALLGLAAAPHALDEFLRAFKPESAARLHQIIAALRQAHVPPPLTVTTAGEKTLLCRAAQAPGARAASVLWLYDITGEARQHARAVQEAGKLKTEIKLYSTILNMTPYPVWQRDQDLNIRYYNLAYSELAEEGGEGAEGAPELDRRARQQARAALAAGEPKVERRHIVADGQRRLVEVREMPVPGENMLVGAAADITEIEQLQEELQRYISAQSDLLESSASAMAIYGGDMRLRSYNYAFAHLWKLDEAWLDTQPSYSEILENLRENRKLPEQANFPQFKQQQIRLFTDLIGPEEEFFYLPDGRALRVIAIPHALGGILFAYEDVTDRLALERSYNTLIAVQRETLDNLHEGIAVFGEDGRLKLSNPVFLDIWSIDPLVAATEPHIAVLIDHAKHLYQYDEWESFRAERIAQIHSRARHMRRLERTDGKVIDCSTVPLPDGGTLLTYLDVTATTLVERSLRERNEALQEADRLKSEFLANVSYELRSPLTTIGGFAEMLAQEYFGGLTDKQKEYVQGIHEASQHLMQLVNDILDLAGIEAGYMQLEVARFDLHEMMKSVLPLIQERSREMDITVTFDCPPKIGKILADETRLRQILFKLLSNAIQFTAAGSGVSFGAREEGEMVALWVADQGDGIPPEEQEAVFQKFYKGSNRASRSVTRSGAGLGLSIVKSFVELHGGRITMESTPGQGTIITCRLPRENEALLQYLKKPARKRGGKSAAAGA
ncbi:MAG: PAS-domain containing protein [Alphaproteobacteria bacterium]|nr:PAS-domain containing protein [Alphaproteobacteria bacterium]